MNASSDDDVILARLPSVDDEADRDRLRDASCKRSHVAVRNDNRQLPVKLV